MQVVLIDMFVVPEESKAAFIEATRQVQGILKTLPGFVEGFLYDKVEGGSRHNFVTTAAWENDAAFENARKTMAVELRRLGVNPQDTLRRLHVEMERAVYHRSPY